MKNIFKALTIGISAAIIDVVPMLMQNLNFAACSSAFTQWIILGLIIPYVNWPMKSWLKGFIIGELAAIPIMILVFDTDPFAVIPIFLFSAFLGSLVGWAGGRFIKL